MARLNLNDPIAIAGAGLSGATIANQLSHHGFTNISVFDERSHIAGNVHTECDPITGIMVHKYGPHVFHTDYEEVWNFVNQHCKMVPYIQRTKALSDGEVYSFPINLHTMSQYYGRRLTPSEARCLIDKDQTGNAGANNFEGAATAAVGRSLYQKFLAGYTSKQWGREPRELPASVAKRLPYRLNFNDNAFDHRFQGIPLHGYTAMVADMLAMPGIEIRLNTRFERAAAPFFAAVFYSGAIDEWFDYHLGALPYRTLEFETLHPEVDDFQGCAVLNCCDYSEPWTRSVEHKHFMSEHLRSRGTVVTREYSREWKQGDVRYYPVRLADDQKLLTQYEDAAVKERNVHFVGRLGTYRYLDMDKTISQALSTAAVFCR